MAESEVQVGLITLGMVGTNCYFVVKDGHCVVFDPADKGDKIYQILQEKELTVDLILLTHGHFDHIAGADKLRELTGAKIGCYIKEQALCKDIYLNVSNMFGCNATINPDIYYEDGDVIEAAGIKMKLIATPGHTSGSCCFYIEEEKILICGDTLFEESVGRTDFPTSSTSELIRSIKDKLFCLPDDTVCYPGHGELTTIGHEKLYNPFVT